MTEFREIVQQIRSRMNRPREVAKALGLKIDQDCGTYVFVRCPVHAEKTGSCSLHDKAGTVKAKCWGCEWGGDFLDLVAVTYGLDGRFKEMLTVACELAGMAAEADELRGGRAAPKREPVRQPEPELERDYPPAAEVALLWSACVPVTEDAEVSALLRARRIDPEAVARLGAGAALHPLTHRSSIPQWARFKGRSTSARAWTESGHRLILPVFDAAGAMLSVRAWLVTGAEGMPKRVPPRGHRASGLVLANARAQRWLRGESRASMIVVCEGEPDFLARVVAFPLETIIGIGSGSWTDEFASRVPFGSEVVLMTHLDHAGDRYADKIAASVRDRAQVTRWTITNEPEEAA